MTDKKRIGIVLAGCGVYDGSEIHEAVLTMLAADKAGAKMILLAPNKAQMHVINHLKGEPESGATRNVLEEAARIARGDIRDLAGVETSELDGLIFPGGFGAAKNLCDFAVNGSNCTVDPDVENLIKKMHTAKKPQGFICIAPVIAAKVLGEHAPTLTIGNDPETASAIEKMGGKHEMHPVDEIAVDKTNKIISTPAYMLGPSIAFVAQGIEKLVNKIIEFA